jgi:hypothetical protein
MVGDADAASRAPSIPLGLDEKLTALNRIT